MTATPWTLSELAATLSHGVKLPGEPTEKPPWPTQLDDEYRRITAADLLARDFSNRPLAVATLASYACTGDSPEVRIRCLQLLAELRLLDPIAVTLVGDPEPDVRCFILEYLLTERKIQFAVLAQQFESDDDWQIREMIDLYRCGKPIPRFYYDPPSRQEDE